MNTREQYEAEIKVTEKINIEPPFHEATLDWYRVIGKHNPDIAVLVKIIEGLKIQLVKSLEAVATLTVENSDQQKRKKKWEMSRNVHRCPVMPGS